MSKQKNHDLEERTKDFAKRVVRLCKKVPKNVITLPIISQLVRAVASVGANYHKANGASSRKDFRNKIFICKKEAKGSEYWFETLIEVISKSPGLVEEGKTLQKESEEYILIFSTIAIKAN